MFRIFRKKREKLSVMYGILQRMGGAVEKRQRRAANYLNERATILSAGQVKTALILFCTVFGGAAVLVTWKALHDPGKTINVQPIRVPDYAVIPGDPLPEQETVLTGDEVRHIQRFQSYLDSLRQTEQGKRTYDSIARFRPGLLDSLAFIQQFYHEQLKSK